MLQRRGLWFRGSLAVVATSVSAGCLLLTPLDDLEEGSSSEEPASTPAPSDAAIGELCLASCQQDAICSVDSIDADCQNACESSLQSDRRDLPPDCFAAGFALLSCLVELSCPGLNAWGNGVLNAEPSYPCRAEGLVIPNNCPSDP